MGRQRNHVPSYRLDKSTGKAVTTVYARDGRRQDITLGVHGTAASKAAFRRILARLDDRNVLDAEAMQDVTIDELIEKFWTFAEVYYRHPDGRPTSELANYSKSLIELRVMFGDKLANSFGPRDLKAIREAMIHKTIRREQSKLVKPELTSRSEVNKMIGRIKRLFRWGVAEQLVNPSILEALRAVDGLKCGRSVARETDRIKPVADAHVDATLPHVVPSVAAMIELQRITGMRPGEVIYMTADQLDTSGEIWLYTPIRHKLAYRNKPRVIPLGKRCQEIIKSFLIPDMTAYLFSPAREREARFTRMRLARRTRVQPSQVCRRKPDAQRLPKPCYDTTSYARAVARGVDKENSVREKALNRPLKTNETVPHWHPNQLRHLAATRLRKDFGLDIAQCWLGHSQITTTQHYAEMNMSKALESAKLVG